jgi:hypothetical protein
MTNPSKRLFTTSPKKEEKKKEKTGIATISSHIKKSYIVQTPMNSFLLHNLK